MPSSIDLDRAPAGVGFVPILLANVIPLVGVVRFGWDPSTLVVIYAIEVLLSFPLAAAKALFAQRPPRADLDDDDSGVVSISNELTRKRGRVTPIAWLPPIYPRNVPFAVAVVGAAAWAGIFIGAVLVGALPVADVIAQPEVAMSVAALFVGQVVESWREYFRGGRYESVSPYAVIETPTRQAFLVAFALIALPEPAYDDPGVVLGAFVLLKLLVEWSAFRATHGGSGRLTGWLSGPDETGELDEPPTVPDDEPDARIPTDGTAVLSTGTLRVLVRRAPFYVPWFFLVWIVGLAVVATGESSIVVTIGSALLVFALLIGLFAVRIVEYYLRYGSLEYRRYGDRLVTYDALLDEPQWATPIDVLRDVEVVSDRLPDRLLGTRSISLTTGWGDDARDRTLGPVAEPDALVDAFELPVRTTELEPIDRRLAAVAVALLVGIASAIVIAAIGPWESPVVVLYAVFLLPFVTLVPRALWRRAYPEG